MRCSAHYHLLDIVVFFVPKLHASYLTKLFVIVIVYCYDGQNAMQNPRAFVLPSVVKVVVNRHDCINNITIM